MSANESKESGRIAERKKHASASFQLPGAARMTSTPSLYNLFGDQRRFLRCDDMSRFRLHVLFWGSEAA